MLKKSKIIIGIIVILAIFFMNSETLADSSELYNSDNRRFNTIVTDNNESASNVIVDGKYNDREVEYKLYKHYYRYTTINTKAIVKIKREGKTNDEIGALLRKQYGNSIDATMKTSDNEELEITIRKKYSVDKLYETDSIKEYDGCEVEDFEIESDFYVFLVWYKEDNSKNEQSNSVQIVESSSEGFVEGVLDSKNTLTYKKIGISDNCFNAYIKELYYRTTGKAISDKDLTNYLNSYKNNEDKKEIQEIVSQIILSKESISKNGEQDDIFFIYNTFKFILNASPDTEGLCTILELLDKGVSRKDIIAYICNSDVFSKYLNNVQKRLREDDAVVSDKGLESTVSDRKTYRKIIESLYESVLNKSIQKTEMDNMIEEISEIGMGGIVYEILSKSDIDNSDEYIVDSYKAIMEEDINEEELSYWTNYLKQGNTRKDYISALCNSSKFKSVYQSNSGGVGNTIMDEINLSGVEGDLNGDGIVTAEDANIVVRLVAYLKIEEVSNIDELIKYADIDENGIINSQDANIIIRYAAEVGTGNRSQNMNIKDYYKTLLTED